MEHILLTRIAADPGTIVPEKWNSARLIILSLTLAAGLALAGGLPLALSAPSERTLTVCPAGPPTCDFQTIQQGLQAAMAGDTILVEAGEYQGPVILKSHVALRSSQGREVTTIVADRGPIVFTQDVVSATLAGFTVDGTNITGEAVGIRAISSQLSLIDNTIQHFQTPNGLSGTVSVGIELGGGGRLAIEATTIADIRGGEGYPGGSAIGVMAIGSGPIEIQATGLTIERLSGGDAGRLGFSSGGDAIAIRTEGAVALVLRDSFIHDLQAGAPYDAGFGCLHNAGATVGIEAHGGTVSAVDNGFSQLSQWASLDGPPGYAIHTVATQGAHLEGNVIDHLMMASRTDWTTRSQAPTGPFCAPPPGTVIAVASEDDAHLTAIANRVTSVHGSGVGGMGIGVDATSTSQVTLLQNYIHSISGGSFFQYPGNTCGEKNACAIGVRIARASQTMISANEISEVVGGQDQYWRECMGSVSSNAMGLSLADVGATSMSNNIIRSVHGGQGSICTTWYPYPTPHGTDGGDAIGLRVVASAMGEEAWIANNVFHLTVGGESGGLGAANGEGVAVHVERSASAEVINNIMTNADLAIRADVMAFTHGDYNDFWQVGEAYGGVLPGAHDLYVAPGFIDLANGNLLLLSGSPMIDAGRNLGAPERDIEGDARPLDGNDDGVAKVDIGADEYWRGLEGSGMAAESLAVSPGDATTYRIVLVNGSTWHDLAHVTMTNTLPIELEYVADSLWAANGVYGHANGVITWRGALPASSQETVTYQVTVDAQITGPRSIVNSAVLHDQIGRPRAVQAIVYVDPVKRYFPFAPMAGYLIGTD